MKEFFKYIKKYKWTTFFVLMTILIEVVATAATPSLMSKVIDEGILTKNFKIISTFGIILFVLSVISILANLANVYLRSKIGYGFTEHLMKKMFEKIQKFSFKNINKFKTSSLLTRVTQDAEEIGQLVANSLLDLLHFPLIFIFALLFALRINVDLTLKFLIIIPFAILIAIVFGKGAHRTYTVLRRLTDKINQTIKENVAGIKIIKSYNLEETEKTRFNKVNTEYKRKNIQVSNILLILEPVLYLVIYSIVGLILWQGNLKIKQGILETGDLFALIMYLSQITSALIVVSSVITSIVSAFTKYKRIVDVLNTEIENYDENINVEFQNFNIEFQNVSYKYPEGLILALDDISLSLKQGQKVAIIGTTGSSKTTLVNLIPRIIEPEKGAILIGGKNVKEYSMKKLLSNIGYVMQDSKLLSGSIKANIQMGNTNIKDKDIYKALDITEASEFVNSYPDKINHIIEQGGTNLSGGQKQRLMLARALVRNPNILILDSATSSIDVTTESKIWENIQKHFPNTTKIIISQRISSIKDSHQIIVLNDGKINNVGTHEELLKIDPIYKEIYDFQSKNMKGVVNEEKEKSKI